MRGKDLAGLFNIVIVLGVLGGLSYMAYDLNANRPTYDEDTLCPTGQLNAHTAVVIDKTDLYTPTQADRIQDLILSSRDQLIEFERLSLFELNESGRLQNTNRFSLCNPGRGDQANQLYENPARIEVRYQALFEGPLQEALADLIEPKDSPSSPIIEALGRLAQQREFDRDVASRRAILVSDMLQNSDLFTFYEGARRDPSTLPDPRLVAEQVEQRYGDVLAGVQIDVFLIPRAGWEDAQQGFIVRYWQEVFRELRIRDRWNAL